jgi:hypothetical protein
MRQLLAFGDLCKFASPTGLFRQTKPAAIVAGNVLNGEGSPAFGLILAAAKFLKVDESRDFMSFEWLN